ncbi:MAG: 3-deoxy-manno-octulosonate cytidylyltransferase [Puniceicoccales bacterium]|jgi:3-deoxy-manno-octulosonate cytidylyltransferase (CMP-KDO synthetase)|nr:3-deoxy-manno-octulosonate cytidylyltransferase [Puniceicoccales bacterium]
MKISVTVPARLQSSRFPQKILQNLGGTPILHRVLERVTKLQNVNEIIALVDDEHVLQLVSEWGFHGMLTSEECASGTERIASVMDQLQGDFIINVQGDEPFVPLDPLEKMILAAQNSSSDVWTAVYPITSAETLFSLNRVKVVIDQGGRAIYFSRSPIPFLRDTAEREQWPMLHQFWGHIGVYGYHKKILTQYSSLKKGILEQAEQLEQLRLLENGISIQCIQTQESTIGIDTQEDLIAAETFLKTYTKF